MAYDKVLSIEEKMPSGNPFPVLTNAVKELFLDTFSHQRHLAKKMEEERLHGHLIEAANYALSLGQYDQAFTLYNQAVAEGNWRANIPAAELAESLGDYNRGLEYRLQAEDYAYAGIDAARLGRREEAQQYWRKLRDG